MGNEFVEYLNTLHNYNAQNPNAYGERNIDSKFFADVVVKVGLCDFICDKIANEEPQTIILTGHAGDGKTSIMYQVLNYLDMDFEADKPIFDVLLQGGIKLHCLKDFSEISDESKCDVLREALATPNEGNYTFMVANTGPLINTFGELFSDPDEKENAKVTLIDAMDRNTGNALEIARYNICVINVAAVDNTYFAKDFLENIIKDELWSECDVCVKKDYCHIFSNRNLIKKNKTRVYDFITMNYIWLTEHGKRLTIRSMTEQLAYMITGGISCEEINKNRKYEYLFSNLFLGYVGNFKNDAAQKILAVREANACGYDYKRLRSDETLLVNRNYKALFGKEIEDLLFEAEKNNAVLSGWAEALRRTYLFLNRVTDEKKYEYDCEDVFSRQFKRFLDLRSGEADPDKTDVNLICDALSMIFIGSTNNDHNIPLTLSRESGIAQNVQLITGLIPTRNIKLVLEPTKDSSFDKLRQRNALKLEINKKRLDCEITLPLLDYFEELKNGVISTNIDPQLSHGVESLKAELSNAMDDDADSFEMIILKNSGNETVELVLTANKRIQVLH